MLSRSKSFRFLRGNGRQEQDNPLPPLDARQTNFTQKRPGTPSGRRERLEAPELAVRPNTSSGPGDRTTMMFRMKKTNPAPSFDSHASPSPIKSTTLLYSAEVTEDQGIIQVGFGLAIGSPTVGSQWNATPQHPSFNEGHMASSGPTTDDSQLPGSRQEPPKSKLSRWKTLFRKAAPPPPQQTPSSFYQVAQMAAAAPRADSHHDDESLEMQVPARQEREMARTISIPTFKPDIRASRKTGADEFIAPRSPPEPPMTRGRAVTLGLTAFNPRSTMTFQRASTAPVQLAKSVQEEDNTVPQVVVSSSATETPSPPSAGGLLDVSIPDIKMERYSVMFGSLLQPNTTQSSSLLVRRQGNAEKLKPLNELSVKEDEQESPMDYKLQRRATSPTVPSPSPRLSLFPSTTPNRVPSPRSASATRAAKALQRSRTAPAKSPLRQTFSQSIPETKAMKADSATLKPDAFLNVSASVTPTSANSYESDTESIIVFSNPQALKVRLDEREPEWEICPKPKPLNIAKRDNSTSVSTSVPPVAATVTTVPVPKPLARTDSQRQPKVTKMSALSSHPASAPLDAPSPLQRLQSLSSPPHSAREARSRDIRSSGKRTASETRGATETAPKAMVGVARSVSVSRANSPRTLVRTMTDRAGTPNSERFVERQALTPVLISLENRQSVRVQLVDA